MVVVDANVLVYAMSEPSAFHRQARRWLESALSGTESVGLPWLSLVAFMRISTQAAVLPLPLTADQAVDVVVQWLEQPPATLVEPGADHLRTVRRLLSDTGTAGNLMNDAHIAAIALEHDAEVVTFDRDFGRFPGVRWRTPGATGPGRG